MTAHVESNPRAFRPSGTRSAGFRDIVAGALVGGLAMAAIGGLLNLPRIGASGASLAVYTREREQERLQRRFDRAVAAAGLSRTEERAVRAALAQAHDGFAAAEAYFALIESADGPAVTGSGVREREHAQELARLVEADVSDRLARVMPEARAAAVTRQLSPLVTFVAAAPLRP